VKSDKKTLKKKAITILQMSLLFLMSFLILATTLTGEITESKYGNLYSFGTSNYLISYDIDLGFWNLSRSGQNVIQNTRFNAHTNMSGTWQDINPFPASVRNYTYTASNSTINCSVLGEGKRFDFFYYGASLWRPNFTITFEVYNNTEYFTSYAKIQNRNATEYCAFDEFTMLGCFEYDNGGLIVGDETEDMLIFPKFTDEDMFYDLSSEELSTYETEMLSPQTFYVASSSSDESVVFGLLESDHNTIRVIYGYEAEKEVLGLTR